ncbi:chemotaxis-specific methylesterase [Oleiphilus messinensis]|uniref:Protein-glutamate methylesterase/protein-glutamine glutaminase n=1 Tax=Oleiphilus messinensis TaxID=141451 RepID=A0A1Y0IBZ9_9GAMM|nr:chemotaxis response regulator protein-glutamate methylesterase [Oleiphilus messinensis]ARU56924.1 chemotaxis-specific methylesterase [Oleiphilus messinensis]
MSIEVLVVDDSAVVRQVISKILNKAKDINVYDVASDPVFALGKMEKKWPDIIVLDIEMPRMDGITFLRKIMIDRPTPVVICSSLAVKGTELSLNALAAGAVDIITKPELGIKGFLEDAEKQIQHTVRNAAKANVSTRDAKLIRSVKTKPPEENILPDLTGMSKTTDRVIAIGTSTGGVQALEVVLTALPRTCPGIVIVQHMPEKFTEAFANRLNSICAIEVIEARSGDRIIPGRALIAPGGKHIEVERSGAQYITRVFSGPAVNRHCPSVDVLFRSVAKHVKQNATGIIMTGMGDDGAQGLLAMQSAGAQTIAQDEASCVVFGMPKEAIKLGAVNFEISLDQIADKI